MKKDKKKLIDNFRLCQVINLSNLTESFRNLWGNVGMENKISSYKISSEYIIS